MTYQAFPTWLSAFSFAIFDQNKIPIFDQSENPLVELRFLDGIGCVVGSVIEIKNIKYKVDEFHFYLNNDNCKASVYIHIIVSEVNE